MSVENCYNAISTSDVDAVKEYFECGGDPNEEKDWVTLFRSAVNTYFSVNTKESFDIVKMFVDNGALIGGGSANSIYFSTSVNRGDVKLLRLLVESKQNKTRLLTYHAFKSAVFNAALYGTPKDLEICQYVFENCPVEMVLLDCITELDDDSDDVVDMFWNVYGDALFKESYECCFLHHLIRMKPNKRLFNCAKRHFVENGGDIDHTNQKGKTPLECAIHSKDIDTVSSLIKSKANPIPHILNIATAFDITDKRLRDIFKMESFDINKKYGWGETVLLRYSTHKKWPTIKFLIDSGADPFSVRDDGLSIFSYCECFIPELCEYVHNLYPEKFIKHVTSQMVEDRVNVISNITNRISPFLTNKMTRRRINNIICLIECGFPIPISKLSAAKTYTRHAEIVALKIIKDLPFKHMPKISTGVLTNISRIVWFYRFVTGKDEIPSNNLLNTFKDNKELACNVIQHLL